LAGHSPQSTTCSFGSGYADAWRDHGVLAAFANGVQYDHANVLWMRHRGHSWERGGEMAAAMNLPLLPLLALDWFDAIPARGVLGLQMMLMMPAMLAPLSIGSADARRSWE
jgi:hypothetical protein